MSTATGAAAIVEVHEAELQGPRQSGRRIRAVCHLHGGDHQRSLSIEAGGEYAGYGFCHSCRTKVFVPELNPQEAERRARGAGREPHTVRRITPASLLRPVRQMSAGEVTPADWQRAELAQLATLDERMRARLADERPRAYLEARGIPYDLAAACGVGYVPADARLAGPLAKWRDRLIFPLGSPAGAGYAGRSLWGWQPGMDENRHKAWLEATADAPRRWEKTYPAGWFGFDELAAADTAVIVEGPVDALALLAAGLADIEVPVVALVGTAARAEWIPANVRGVLLALDGDASGSKAGRDLARELSMAGVAVALCVPPVEDGRGKDWAERWRRAQWEGVDPVLAALDALPVAPVVLPERAVPMPVEQVEPVQKMAVQIPADNFAAPATQIAAAETPAGDELQNEPADLATAARGDAVVRELLAMGYQLVEVLPCEATA